MLDRYVRDIMSAPVHFSPRQTTVREACRVMSERSIHCVVVMEDNKLLGLFTGRDAVRRVIAAGHDPDATPIGKAMTPEPDALHPEQTVAEAIRMMDEFGYSHLPVVEDNIVIGIVSFRDLPLGELDTMRPELEHRHSIAERAW